MASWKRTSPFLKKFFKEFQYLWNSVFSEGLNIMGTNEISSTEFPRTSPFNEYFYDIKFISSALKIWEKTKFPHYGISKKSKCDRYKYILRPLFDVRNATPPRVLKLGPWNFQRRWPMLWGWSAREDFLTPPPQPAPGSKRCHQIRSGGPSAYFRASFAKYKLLGIVWGVINFFKFSNLTPTASSRLKKMSSESVWRPTGLL